jgi:hypothetical protein
MPGDRLLLGTGVQKAPANRQGGTREQQGSTKWRKAPEVQK